MYESHPVVQPTTLVFSPIRYGSAPRDVRGEPLFH